MNYEKAYKEALERAKNLHKDAIDMGENIRAKQCEIIFSELKEDEDERIRKTLIEYFNAYPKEYFGGLKKRYIVAWLEKQDKQKSADEVLKIRQEVYQSGYNDGYKHGIEDVKQGEQEPIEWKEEDLEKEFGRYCEGLYAKDIQEAPFTKMYDCAKHFYELGIKAKGE